MSHHKSKVSDLGPGDSCWVNPNAFWKTTSGDVYLSTAAPFQGTNVNMCSARVEIKEGGCEVDMTDHQAPVDFDKREETDGGIKVTNLRLHESLPEQPERAEEAQS